MIVSEIAKRYAGALFDIAKEEDRLRDVFEELQDFLPLLNEHGDLKEFFANPAVDRGDKKEVMEKVLAKVNISVVTGNFLRLLVDKNRIDILDQIIACYQNYLDDVLNIMRIGVKAALPLSDTLLRRIQGTLKSITEKNVELQVEDDPSLLGGIIVKVGDRIYDGSVKAQLNSIRELIGEEM